MTTDIKDDILEIETELKALAAIENPTKGDLKAIKNLNCLLEYLKQKA
jgi:hypothetical protein